MTDLELDALMYGSNIGDKGEWERCRFLAYITACSMGAKIKTPQDLITFDWEKQEVPTITVTKDERNKLIKQYMEELNNGKWSNTECQSDIRQ